MLDHAHALAAAGRPEALEAYRAVLARDPDCADAANNLGVLLRQRGEDAEAGLWYRRALDVADLHPDASYNLGRLLLDSRQPAEAIAPLRLAVVLRPVAERLHTLGRALQATGALGEAKTSYEAALRLAPDGFESLNNLANVFQALGEPQRAVDLLDRALAAHPANAEMRYNRALALLLQGCMVEGWRAYETRWQARGFPSPYRDFGLPRWNGTPAPQATLLVHWEQGLGDTIQFARYVAAARGRVGRVVLLVQPPLKRLLTGIAGADMVLTEGETLPPADLHVPLLSLPHLLQCPVLPAPVALQCAHSSRERSEKSPQVGLVWAGNPAHANDANRSLPPGALAPVLAVPGVTFHNLQLGARRDEIPAGPFAPADLADTAAIVAGLDLLITVDTAMAHLAATLGIDVWLLLPFAPDWRWGRLGTTTQWYPTMRLFRQQTAGHWTRPVADIAAALQRRAR